MKRNKYGAVKTTIDGIIFDSKAEAKRYGELKMLERSGFVTNVIVHRVFPLLVNGVKVASYESDFTYESPTHDRLIVEDVKGVKTSVYRLKKKIFEAIYPHKITEITK